MIAFDTVPSVTIARPLPVDGQAAVAWEDRVVKIGIRNPTWPHVALSVHRGKKTQWNSLFLCILRTLIYLQGAAIRNIRVFFIDSRRKDLELQSHIAIVWLSGGSIDSLLVSAYPSSEEVRTGMLATIKMAKDGQSTAMGRRYVTSGAVKCNGLVDHPESDGCPTVFVFVVP